MAGSKNTKRCLATAGVVTQYAVKQGRLRLWDSLKYISEAYFSIVASMVLHAWNVLASYWQPHIQRAGCTTTFVR